jgi:cobalt/nickel transport system permease protein
LKNGISDSNGSYDSVIHRIDPVAKIPAALAAIVLIVSEPLNVPISRFALYMLIILFAAALSRIPLMRYLKRMLVVSPFIAMAAVFYPLSLYLSSRELFLLDSDIIYNTAAVIMMKAVCALFVLLLLTLTSRFTRVMPALRRLGVPPLAITLAALTYRYIFILSDELQRTNRARESRTPGRLVSNRLGVYGNQVAVIFLRSWERSETVYKSMLSRGFTGEFPYSNYSGPDSRDFLIATVFVIAISAVRFISSVL